MAKTMDFQSSSEPYFGAVLDTCFQAKKQI